MSFLRHEEIYRPDVRLGQKLGAATPVAAPVLIGCDEFPVGYSLAGCPPAEPASASPTGHDSQQSTLPYNDFSANGNYPLNFVSQSKGALQIVPPIPIARTVLPYGFDCGVLTRWGRHSCPSAGRSPVLFSRHYLKIPTSQPRRYRTTPSSGELAVAYNFLTIRPAR
jgi:hypothetical protein